MYKNLAIIALILLVIGESGYILKLRNDRKKLAGMPKNQTLQGQRPPQMLTAGMKLSNSQIAKFAFKITPGELDENAKTALIGWDISQTANKDGSIAVTLNPKNSDDQKQIYTVKPGQSLYFVETTSADDKADKNEDVNLRDDYGILVNADGIVQ